MPHYRAPWNRKTAISPEFDQANMVTAFVASPLLTEPTQLKVDHVAALLALAVEGPARKAAFSLFTHHILSKRHRLSRLRGHHTLLRPLTTPWPVARYFETQSFMLSALPTLQPNRRWRLQTNWLTTQRIRSPPRQSLSTRLWTYQTKRWR